MKPRPILPWWVRLRLHLDSLDRYHAGATLVLVAGILGGFLAAAISGPSRAWSGSLATAAAMFVLLVVVSFDPD